MKVTRGFSAVLVTFVLAALVALPAPAAAAAVTPIQKVIELMNGMLGKAKAEKQDEKVRFAAFQQFCTSQNAEKKGLIQAGADAIAKLDADITKAEADADRLGQEISEIDADLDGWEQEMGASKKLRKEENTAYVAEHLDYEESLSALERAIKVLKSKSADTKQAAPEEAKASSMVEVRKVLALPRLTSNARSVLATFLQGGVVDQAGAPEANSYEFQSSSVVDMLEELRLRFQDEMLAIEKEEMNKKHAFDMVMQRLTDEVNAGKDTRAEKAQARGQRKADAGEWKGDLADTTEAKAADETFLRDLVAECAEKSEDYEKRQVLRKGEIEAIGKAIEIISSPAVAGAGSTYLPGAALLQAQKPQSTSLAQLRSAPEQQSLTQERTSRAASLLMRTAVKTNSRLLTSMAERMTDDPFAKVKQMIKDLLVRLMEEANDEADHKAWCDEELSTNKATRDQKSADVEDLTSQIDENTALAAKLQEEISDLRDAISEIAAAVAKATNARQEEKAKNAVVVSDAKAAQEAVTQALKVLKEYYAQASTATAFVQAKAKADPRDFGNDGPFQGQQAESGGVIGMLEVVQSDFARLEADTSSSEGENQREFDTFIEDSDTDSKAKDKSARHKGFEETRTVRALNQAKKDLESTQEELDAALEYFDKLKPSCIDTGLSYEERVARRKEEIQSLQEALKILNGEDLSGTA